MENYEHYISRNIKSIYRRKLPSPVIFLILLSVLWFHFSIFDIIHPVYTNPDNDFEVLYDSDIEYVVTSMQQLYFTGYTEEFMGRTNGYYYYTMWNNQCTFVLLSPDTCEEGLPQINNLTFRGKIEKSTPVLSDLMDKLSSDLSWTRSGILGNTSGYYLNEPDYHYGTSIFLVVLFLLSASYAVFHLVSCILYIIFPFLCPGIQQLSHFGKPRELLALAEEELATLPQLATEDMFITEHYFIEVAANGIAIVPISEIIWIYKHSTLHKFLWYHFSISYTLSIAANKHVYIQCPKNIKSDIDGIIDYLSEANHSILVGFNEENRLKVQELQGTPLQLDKLLAFLKKRI